MSELPKFPELFGEVSVHGDSWIYYEHVSVGADEEAHDVVEPAYAEAREAIEGACYVVDYGNSGCDHDSFWVYFRGAPLNTGKQT